MYQENVVLCGASAYEQKYYFNQDFASLPETIKQELQVMCVLYTEKRELLESLEMYYRVFFLGEDMEESVEHVDNEE